MDKFFDGILSPMMETNRGCPFSCTFCHEGNALISKVNKFSLDRVKAELDYIAAAVERAPNFISNLMFADPNFDANGSCAVSMDECRSLGLLGWGKSKFEDDTGTRMIASRLKS
jgi:radical SAM superfamily enzyme YgiQ (UPF0313 family)